MAAGRGGPVQEAGFWLLQPPAFGLFTSVMVAAEWGQVAFAGPATLVIRSGVVEVALGGRPPAAGRGAGRIAGPDQMPELPARLVARLLVAVVAGVLGQWVEHHRQASGGQVLQAC